MTAFLAQHRYAGWLQKAHYSVMRGLVGQCQRTVIRLLLYSEILCRVIINMYNVASGLQSRNDSCL